MNGVPLRRVNQAYVIATSKSVDVSGVKLPETVNDKFFKAAEEGKTGKSEAAFFEERSKVCARPIAVSHVHCLPACALCPLCVSVR